METLKAKKVGGGRGNKGQENPEFEYQGIDLKKEIPGDVHKQILESLKAEKLSDEEVQTLMREFIARGFNYRQRMIASDPFFDFFRKLNLEEDVEKTLRATANKLLSKGKSVEQITSVLSALA